MDFSNKIVIVTGAGQGIGACIAMYYAKYKANVVIAEMNKQSGKYIEKEIKSKGQNALFIHTDIGNEQSVKAMVEQVVSRYGKIDILINNATMNIDAGENILSRSVESFEQALKVNVVGTYACVKYCVPYMIEDGCSIINIASTRAFMSEPNTEPYSASKGALVALTHSLATSLGPKIRVNAISPGWIETSKYQFTQDCEPTVLSQVDHQQHPVGRVGIPEDIAHAVCYLTHEKSSFITGMNMVIDGGMTIKMIYEE